jgi:tetratricopeptide (TPR) repeat protein
MNNLSNVLSQTNRLEEAGRLSSDALAIQRRVLGPNHPAVALALGTVARRTLDLAVSESLFKEARDIQRAAFGPQDTAVARTDTDLGNILQARGKYDEAEAMFREGLAIRERLVGPERSVAANSMINLAGLLRSNRNKPVEAESLYIRALGILRQETPLRPSRLVGALWGLENLAHVRGDHARAEALSREVLDAHQRSLGLTHPITTEAMEAIAEHLAAQGRHAPADSILTDALALLQRSVGTTHIRTGTMLMSRGRLRALAGRWADAEGDLRSALSALEGSDAAQSEYAGAAAALLAQIAQRQGNTAETTELFDRAAKKLRTSPRNGAYDVVAAYRVLADHYRALGKAEDAAYFRRLIR